MNGIRFIGRDSIQIGGGISIISKLAQTAGVLAPSSQFRVNQENTGGFDGQTNIDDPTKQWRYTGLLNNKTTDYTNTVISDGVAYYIEFSTNATPTEAKLIAINISDGSIKYQQALDDNEGFGSTEILATEDYIITSRSGGSGDYFKAYNKADGSDAWKYDVSGEIEGYTYYRQHLIYGRSSIKAYSIPDDAIKWEFSNIASDKVNTKPAVDSEGNIYFTVINSTGDDDIYSIAFSEGTLNWSNTTPREVETNPVVIGPDSVYVVTESTNVDPPIAVSYDKSTGSQNWSTGIGAGARDARSPIAYHDGYLYITDNDALYVINASNGSSTYEEPYARDWIWPDNDSTHQTALTYRAVENGADILYTITATTSGSANTATVSSYKMKSNGTVELNWTIDDDILREMDFRNELTISDASIFIGGLGIKQNPDQYTWGTPQVNNERTGIDRSESLKFSVDNISAPTRLSLSDTTDEIDEPGAFAHDYTSIYVMFNDSTEAITERIVSIDKYTGNIEWNEPAGTRRHRIPVTDSKKVYFVNEKPSDSYKYVYALDTDTGSVVWKHGLPNYNANVIESTFPQRFTHVAISDGDIFVTQPGISKRLDANTGTVIWETETIDPPSSSNDSSYSYFFSSPTVDEDNVYVAEWLTNQDDITTKLVVLSKLDGSRVAQPDVYVDGGISVTDDSIITQSGTSGDGDATAGGLVSVDKDTFNVNWETGTDVNIGAFNNIAPCIGGGRVYIPRVLTDAAPNSEVFRAYDLDTGNEIWRKSYADPADDERTNTPIYTSLNGGTLIHHGPDESGISAGAIREIDPSDGSVIRKGPQSTTGAAALSVFNGRLYFTDYIGGTLRLEQQGQDIRPGG